LYYAHRQLLLGAIASINKKTAHATQSLPYSTMKNGMSGVYLNPCRIFEFPNDDFIADLSIADQIFLCL
jgi:hypothetical protein